VAKWPLTSTAIGNGDSKISGDDRGGRRLAVMESAKNENQRYQPNGDWRGVASVAAANAKRVDKQISIGAGAQRCGMKRLAAKWPGITAIARRLKMTAAT